MSWISDGSAADDRSEIRASAHTRAFPAISQRSTPADPSDMRRNAPPRAAGPHLATITPGPRPRFHGHVDTMGVRSLSETRGVDLIMNTSAWRAVPDSRRTLAAPEQGAPGAATPLPSTPSRVDVAGLAALPNPVVAWTAVPAPGARPFPTRPSPPGTHATILWSASLTQGDHRLVASLRTGRARTQVREASRASRNATTPSVVLQPGHRTDRSARRAHSRSRW
jgi:hypothetical protein